MSNNKRELIDGIGTVTASESYVRGGMMEIHIMVDILDEPLISILDKCSEDFLEKHPTIPDDEVFFDIGIGFSLGKLIDTDSEFTLSIIVFHGSADDEDGVAEFYDEIPVEFDEEDEQKIRQMICDAFNRTVMK